MTKGKIEEKELNKGRGIAKKLDISLNQMTNQSGFCTLKPGAKESNNDAENDTNNRKFQSGPKPG